MLDKPGKTNVLPVFPLMVGEVMNIIGDLIGTTAGPARNKGPLMVGKVLRADSTDNAFQRHDEKAGKKNWEPTIVITCGNVIAKKIDMGDNFRGYDVFSTETESLIR